MLSSAYLKAENKKANRTLLMSSTSTSLSTLSANSGSVTRKKLKNVQRATTITQFSRFKKPPQDYKSKLRETEPSSTDSIFKLTNDDLHSRSSMITESIFEDNNDSIHIEGPAIEYVAEISDKVVGNKSLFTSIYHSSNLENALSISAISNVEPVNQAGMEPHLPLSTEPILTQYDSGFDSNNTSFTSDDQETDVNIMSKLIGNNLPMLFKPKLRRNSWESTDTRELAKAHFRQLYSMLVNRSADIVKLMSKKSINVNTSNSQIPAPVRRIVIQHCKKCCPHDIKNRQWSFFPQSTSLNSVFKAVPLYSPFSSGLDVHLNYFRSNLY